MSMSLLLQNFLWFIRSIWCSKTRFASKLCAYI